MFYESLMGPYRQIVDRLVTATTGVGWEDRRAYMSTLYYAMVEEGRHNREIAVARDFPMVMAAMLERWGTPPVVNRIQAVLYGMSISPHHQAAANLWFDDNPQELAALKAEMEAMRAATATPAADRSNRAGPSL